MNSIQFKTPEAEQLFLQVVKIQQEITQLSHRVKGLQSESFKINGINREAVMRETLHGLYGASGALSALQIGCLENMDELELEVELYED